MRRLHAVLPAVLCLVIALTFAATATTKKPRNHAAAHEEINRLFKLVQTRLELHAEMIRTGSEAMEILQKRIDFTASITKDNQEVLDALKVWAQSIDNLGKTADLAGEEIQSYIYRRLEVLEECAQKCATHHETCAFNR